MINRYKYNYFMAGLFIGLVIVGGVFAFFQPSIVVTTTENAQDCVSKGGEYSLSVKSDGEIYYEWCEINKKIRYNQGN